MKNLSRFDLGMIIAFVVVGLLGGGAWYYLSGEIASAQDEVRTANDNFIHYSSKEVYLPTPGNVKILQANVDLMRSQIDPLVKSRLQPPDNKLSTAHNEDTVAWKKKLDAQISALNNAAKIHGVDVPANYYYSFARYLNQAPAEEKTAVLSKQLLAVEQIATALINAPVKSIKAVRRAYEEDARPVTTAAPPAPGAPVVGGDNDSVGGRSVDSAGGVYRAYPFEVEFDATTDACRKVINALVQSPYFFVIRSVSCQTARLDSPQIGDLDHMAGVVAPTTSILDSSPGETAATKSTAGPQFLFGSEVVHVKLRIDFIEWMGIPSDASAAPKNPQSHPGKTPEGK